VLVVRGMGEVPAALARNEGPYASGYVLPDPSTLGTPAKKTSSKKKAPAASSSSSAALTTTTDAATSLVDRLKDLPAIVWILLGLGVLGGVWWYTGKRGKGRRRGRGRPFARRRRR